MNIYDLPPNCPNYHLIQIGDVFMWFVGNSDEFDEAGKRLVHGHLFEVVSKGTRMAEIEVKMLKCDSNKTHKYCGGFEIGKTYVLGWSKIEVWREKTRWLRTPGAKTLFQERGNG